MLEYPAKDFRFIIYDMAAHRLVGVSPSSERQVPIAGHIQGANVPATLLEEAARFGSAYATIVNEENTDGARLLARTVDIGGQTYTVIVMRSLDDVEDIVGRAGRALFIGVPLALLCASLGGYFLARKSLAPVVLMSETAARIGATNLHERLPVTNERDELGKLAGVFNNLLARLHESFEQQRRFMADASHELRTPLSIVRGESEVALSKDERTSEDLRESLAIVHDEGRRLTGSVEDLFTLARADAGQYTLATRDLYLDELACEVARSVRTLAAKREVMIDCEASVELPFHGDESLLRRMMTNLLDNALKHTPRGRQHQGYSRATTR
ncbi:MAG: histidine kinase dimerization/phospho-acceptor domain-containing protein [Pyrinomonadaceae bacterium]